LLTGTSWSPRLDVQVVHVVLGAARPAD